jgi:hypothetical protein
VTDFQYIKFNFTPSTPEAKKKNNRKAKILGAILFFIPKGNPEYDEIIGDVAEWQLEIDTSDNLPNRELGKDINGNIILIMPWRDNYGYWTDNNITIDYFQDHFKATNIDKAEFEKNWDTFAKNNPDKTN